MTDPDQDPAQTEQTSGDTEDRETDTGGHTVSPVVSGAAIVPDDAATPSSPEKGSDSGG